MVSGPYSRTCAVPHGLNWRCKGTTLPRFIRVFARRVEIGNTALWLERVELRNGPHLLCPSGWICASRRIIPTTSWNEAARELVLNCTPQGRDGQERDLFSSGWLEGLSADRYEHRMRLGGFDLASLDGFRSSCQGWAEWSKTFLMVESAEVDFSRSLPYPLACSKNKRFWHCLKKSQLLNRFSYGCGVLAPEVEEQ